MKQHTDPLELMSHCCVKGTQSSGHVNSLLQAALCQTSQPKPGQTEYRWRTASY